MIFDKNPTKEKIKDILKGRFKGKEVLVKLHMGEPGNKNSFTPDDIKPYVKALKELGFKATLFDTPVKYNSPRNSVKGYKKVAKQKGFDGIADVLISNDSVKAKTKDFTAEVARPLAEAENVLVLSHVKGHICSGFGGAIKNLGMGGTTKECKVIQHTLGQPEFVKECQGCGLCTKLCPLGAITMKKGKANVDHDCCAGCSICILNCPYDCYKPKKELFDDLLAQAAVSVIKKLKNAYYINIIKKICKECDCASETSDMISDDIGVLFDEDALEIDKRSLELIKEKNGKDIFLEANHKDPMLQIKFAKEYI